MADLNKVMLIGRLTRDIELKYVSSGTAVGEVGMAVNRNYTKGNGEKVDETAFIEIVIWGKQAETANQYLSKGSSCFIEGRLNFEQWEDKNSGQKRSKLNVVADRVQFLDPKQSGEPYKSNEHSQKKFADQMEGDFDVEGDDIPF